MKINVNIAQLFEQEINATSKIIEKRLRSTYEVEGEVTKDMEDLFFSYIYELNKRQHENLSKIYPNLSEERKNEFWDIILNDGIYVEQGPMTNNVNLEELYAIYDKFDINLKQKLEGIENEIIIGDVYYMTLRHHPMSKFSARSGAFTDQTQLPAKSMAYSKKEAPHQTTAIRLGEMEVNNLFIIKDVKKVVDMLSMYSTNTNDRQAMTQKLLTGNPFDIDKIPNTGTTNKTSDILDATFKGIGITLRVIED